MVINSDIPIVDKKEDLLNRSSFAEQVATAIVNRENTDTLCVGLYGPWGSGKTSLLNMIYQDVQNKDKSIVVVIFEPWICNDPKAMISQFFNLLSKELKIKGENYHKTWELISKYSSAFSFVKYIPTAGPFFNIGLKSLGTIAEANAKSEPDIKDIKTKITKQIIEDKVKFIISIDDIDRLSDDEIVSVFQLVKSLADFPNTTYILAFDYGVVTSALNKMQAGYGPGFLEKIIQVPFHIPKIDRDELEKILFERLRLIMGEPSGEKWDDSDWATLYTDGIKPYIKTIRDINRFMNRFMLKYALLKEEVFLIDLIGITCLQVFEPEVYEELYWYKDELLGSSLKLLGKNESERNDYYKEQMNDVVSRIILPNHREACCTIIGVLFPVVSKALGVYHSGGYYSDEEIMIKQRIASPQCFNRYFTLTLGSKEIPDSTIRSILFLQDEETIIEVLNHHYHNDNLNALLELLYKYLHSQYTITLSNNRATIIIRALSLNWHKFEKEEYGFLKTPLVWKYQRCLEELLIRIDKEKRGSVIKELFENESIQIYTKTIILSTLGYPINRYYNNNNISKEAFIDEEELEDIENIFIMESLRIIDNREWITQYNGFYFWSLFSKINKKLAESKLEDIIVSDMSLAKVICYCMRHGNSNERIWCLDNNTLEQLTRLNTTEFTGGLKCWTKVLFRPKMNV